MPDLLKLFICQLQPEEPLRLRHRIPQRVIRAEGHPLRAVGVDVLLRHTVLHEHQRTGYIKNAILVPQQFESGFIHAVAAKMRGDDLQFREQIQHPPQLQGMRVIISVISHVQDHRQLTGNGIIHRKQPGIVDGEPLGIRVHFNPLQSFADDVCSNICHYGTNKCQ